MTLDINAIAAAAQDTATESAGNFVRPIAREGVALLRLRDYVETGKKEGSWKGQTRVNNSCFLTFELLHPEHLVGEGDKQFPLTLTVYLNKSSSPRAKYFKLLKKMNFAGKAKNFAGLLGNAFLGTLTHNVVGDKTYVNLDKEGEWQISAPQIVDPLSNSITQIPVPELHGDMKLFLIDPSLSSDMVAAMWASIYIEGERDDGRSKNWMQEKILESIDFDASYVDFNSAAIVATAEAPVTPVAPVAEVPAPAAPMQAPEAAAAPTVTPAAPVVAGPVVAPAPAEAAVPVAPAAATDPLAALGL